jgi:uncharacterized linocin/CFP29 family protein
MNHLLRSHAPITEAGWGAIDTEARERLLPALGARRLVDFSDPGGWEHSATGLGRVRDLKGEPVKGVEARQRRVLELVELRAPFGMARDELRDLDRGAADIDFDSLDAAAARIAVAENLVVFHGLSSAGIAGVVERSSHAPIALGKGAFERYPAHVARALEMLLSAGIGGPYGLALGPDSYTGVLGTVEPGGYPLIDHLRQLVGGPLVWTPGLGGAVLLSLRGGDFLLDCGQDLAVGYLSHDEREVQLYLEESLSFRVVTPEAAVALPEG